jgi:hypothetical protein
MASLTSCKIWAKVTAGWTDISDDVIWNNVRASWGITGTTPLDRTPDTGMLQFTLDNASGEYTPGGPSVTAGWQKGIQIKCVMTYDGDENIRFFGTLDSVEYEIIAPTLVLAHCTVVDWINYVGEHPILTPALQLDQTAERGIDLIIASMPVQPAEVVLETGVSSLPSIFDIARARTTAMNEFARLTDSELGYLYLQKSQNAGERLVFENAWHRNGLHAFAQIDKLTSEVGAILKEDGDILLTEAGDYLLLNEAEQVAFSSTNNIYFNDVTVEHGSNLANHFTAAAYPRESDTSAVVLYTLGHPMEIGNGETLTWTASYTDPDGGAQVGGFDMVTPVITTDYLLNTLADGTGTNLSTDATVTVSFGGSRTEIGVKNGSTLSGFIILFNLRGKGLYTYNPANWTGEDANSIDSYGYIERNLDLKYQGDLLAGSNEAKRQLYFDCAPRNVLRSIAYLATQNSDTLSSFLTLDIGSLIEVSESIIGISGAYFIQNIAWELDKVGIIRVTYGLVEHWSYLANNLTPLTVEFGGTGTKEAINYHYLPQVVQTSARTYAAWAYRDTNGVYGHIICGPFADGGGTFLEISSANRPIFYSNLFNVNPGEWRTTDTDTFMAGGWHHIAVTYNAWSSTDDPLIYIDGASKAVTEFQTPSGTLNSEYGAEVVIGNWHTDTQDYGDTFDGKIKDVRIYNRLVTSDEVTTLYNGGVPDASLVTDGLVFQGPCVPSYLESTDWTVVTINSSPYDYLLENIYRNVGVVIKPYINEPPIP